MTQCIQEQTNKKWVDSGLGNVEENNLFHAVFFFVNSFKTSGCVYQLCQYVRISICIHQVRLAHSYGFLLNFVW